MYSLIEFPMDNGQKPEVEVVPKVWLKNQGEVCYCFWPRTRTTEQIRKAVEKCYLPDNTWMKYKCRVLHTYDSYDDARKKLVDAEFTSTLETDIELCEHKRPKRKLKRNRIYSDSSPDSLDSGQSQKVSRNKIIPSPPMMIRTPTKNSNILPRRFIDTSPEPSTSTADSSLKHTSNVIISSPRVSERAVSLQNTLKTTLISSEFHKSDDFPYLILTKLVSLENSMNLLLPMIKQLAAHFRLSKIPHVENVPEMPIDTDEKLTNLEKFLNIKQNFDYMVNVLAISGGTTTVQITRRTLERIMTNNYAKNFNWAGRAPKKAFKALKIKDLIIAAVRNVEPNASIDKIENSIKDWLKLSSIRVALAEVRASKKLSTPSATTNYNLIL